MGTVIHSQIAPTWSQLQRQLWLRDAPDRFHHRRPDRAQQPVATENGRWTRATDFPTLRLACLQ
ncbi:MAG: hypothetical protein OEW98_00320 [Betaproteobacteria bacterium]|jgi:hypothetical protein|nr:hypothetical protein [Betaproteobacteria bacterium]